MVKNDFYIQVKSAIGITIKEVMLWLRIWPRSIIPPIISTITYVIIFGEIIGHYINNSGKLSIPYAIFISPGIIMMISINSSYSNVAYSFFGAKVMGDIKEILYAPVRNSITVLGYCLGGILRTLTITMIILLLLFILKGISVLHPFLFLLILIMNSLLFCLIGFCVGIVARTFDDTGLFMNFILSPLVYFGGVFYDSSILHGNWLYIYKLDPIHYIANLYRYSVLGIREYNIFYICVGEIIIIFILYCFSVKLIELLLRSGRSSF